MGYIGRRPLLGGSEVFQILLSALVLGLAFSMLIGFSITGFVWVLLTVGIGFIGHELAHKFMALRFGYWASYRIWPMGLVLALLLAFVFRFIFAALGAVEIYGRGISRDEQGIISLSGPAFNMVLVVIFMGLAAVLPAYSYYFGIGAWLNALIALFNCVPFSILDGSKIFSWNKPIWLLAIGVSAVLFLINWIPLNG